MKRRTPEKERDGREAGAGWGEDWGRETDWRGPRCAEGNGGVGDRRVKIRPTDQGEVKPAARKERQTRGRAGGWNARPAESLHARKGRTGGGAGKPRPAARSGGVAHLPLCSPRNTSLNFLSGFPKSPPADMMEPEDQPPPQPRDLPNRRCPNPLTKKARGGGRRALGHCRARAAQQGFREDSSPRTGNRHCRLPAESPSTERGPRLGREGGRCRKQPGVCFQDSQG